MENGNKSEFFSSGGAALTSDRSEWETPPETFEKLDEEFNFTLDAAASVNNRLCDDYFSKENDALFQNWRGRVFVNPPYDRKMRVWIQKCCEEVEKGHAELVCALIPARTDTSYWHDFIFNKAEIRFLRARQKFRLPGEEHNNPAPFASAVVIWRKKSGLRKGDAFLFAFGINFVAATIFFIGNMINIGFLFVFFGLIAGIMAFRGK